MINLPLYNFFISLQQADDIRLSVRDYEKLLLVFQSRGAWTISKLKNVLLALLAKEQEMQRLIGRKFDIAFEKETDFEKSLPYIDIKKVFDELEEIPHPPPPPPSPTPLPTQTPPPATPLMKTLRRSVWGMFIIFAAVMGILGILPDKTPTLPVLKLSTDELDFGYSYIGSSATKSFTLKSAENGESLRIESAAMTENSSQAFTISFPPLPLDIERGKEIAVSVSFTPKSATPKSGKNFSGEVLITHTGKNRTSKISLKGFAKSVPPDDQIVTLGNIRYVRNIEHVDPPVPPDTWKIYALLFCSLLFIALLYGIYLWYLAHGPKDKPPVLDEDGQKYFNPGSIGGAPEAILDEEILGYLVDRIGYFTSEEPGQILDVPLSIRATVDNGGVPTCEFYNLLRIRTLLILEDSHAEALEWNPLAKELAEGMEKYGVPVVYGKFGRTLNQFKTEQEDHVQYIEDLEDHRSGIVMLIFTDGKSFHRPENMFVLESIACWPMKAWMDLRQPRFWDETLMSAIKNDISVYHAGREGIIEAFGSFLTEIGEDARASKHLIHGYGIPHMADVPLKVWIKDFLGDALSWVQDCSMIQPISHGMADKLRKKFHPRVDYGSIESLYYLPNTTRTSSGFRFSSEALAILKQGFLTDKSDQEQAEVMEFILARVEDAKPENAGKGSFAMLSWEAFKERVSLEAGCSDEKALKAKTLQRFGELMHSPLKKWLEDSLANCGFGQSPNQIPLRFKPSNTRALQRLKLAKKNGLNIGSLNSLIQRATGLTLMIGLIFLAGLIIKVRHDEQLPFPNLEITDGITAGARLDIFGTNGWKPYKKIKDVKSICLDSGKRYRMVMTGDRWETRTEFDVPVQKKVVLETGKSGNLKKLPAHVTFIYITVAKPEVPKAGRELFVKPINMKFVWIPAGEFQIGCSGDWAGDCDSDEKPGYFIKLDGFNMGKYEVTNAQFALFLNATGRSPKKNEPWFETKREDSYSKIIEKNSKFFVEKGYENHPVVNVSWYGAKAFAKWLSTKIGNTFDLPTEAQWEYACRNQGEDVLYCGGNEIDKVAWYLSNSGGGTHEVGQRENNGIGLYDMSGNVSEWCNDWYGDYSAGKPIKNPVGKFAGTDRVMRGGSWSLPAKFCRSTFRNSDRPGDPNDLVGFRLILLSAHQ